MLNINKLRILKARTGLLFPNIQTTSINGTILLPDSLQHWEQFTTSQLFQNPYLQSQPLAEPYKNYGDFKLSTFTNPALLAKNSDNILDKIKNSITPNYDLIGTGLDTLNQSLFTKNITNSSAYNNIQAGLGTLANIAGISNPMLGLGIRAGSVILNGINNLGAKKSKTFSIDKELQNNMGGSYLGSYNFMNEASQHSGESVGLFSRSKLNKYNQNIDKATLLQSTISEIYKDASDARNNNSNLKAIAYNLAINGGLDFKYASINKFGGRIKNLKNLDYTPNLELEPIIDLDIYEPNQNFEPSIVLFKNGGKSEISSAAENNKSDLKNIIPEGALHAHKHHMDNDENITKKGIPVIDDEGNQQAEIERDEIIFTLEVTKKLERLYKEYFEKDTKQSKKDELAKEAGAILVYEILHNTEDKTNLIEKCLKGGILHES